MYCISFPLKFSLSQLNNIFFSTDFYSVYGLFIDDMLRWYEQYRQYQVELRHCTYYGDLMFYM